MKSGYKKNNNNDIKICYDNSCVFKQNAEQNLAPEPKNNINCATLAMLGNKKVASKYNCDYCDYITDKKSHYDKHIETQKHQNNVNNGCHNRIKHVCCNCNKEYIHYNALWKHHKKCAVKCNDTVNVTNIEEEKKNELQMTSNNTISADLITEVLKQGKELQNVLIEQNKDLQNKLLEKDNMLIEQNNKILELAKNQSTINNNNTTNQQFNLQFFLNETCKDAMNIVDFVNSLKLTIDDFETTGRLGFVDGISRIFIKELKKIETEKLPIHCTDLKRETVYIKDNDIWGKENDDKHKLKWTIDRIAQLNLNQIQQWQEKYPQCKENNTKENHRFTELALVALGGRGEEEEEKLREKIIRNVIKEVVLNKQNKYIK
jgi:hypothetical protein